jgi:hypothetical protein
MWAGHFHANMTTLHALLDLAIAQDNEWLKQFVREGYDHAIRNGVVRVGWFPMWTVPEKYRRNKNFHMEAEGCGVADMVILAVKLIDAGRGDYWDDVDYIVRNRLAAAQFSDVERMRKSSGCTTPECDEIIERSLGAFSVSRAAYAHPVQWGCCTPNGTYALYYAWHGITRFENDVATVNLFLNRASEWMDVHSYLPYEGKVVLKNKKARAALVRIPAWVAIDEVKSSVDAKDVNPARAGRYLVFQDLKPRADITLNFPLVESTGRYFIHNKEFAVTFRGSTVIDIDPPMALDDGLEDHYWSLYEWDHAKENFAAGRTPSKKIKQFVPARILPLQ